MGKTRGEIRMRRKQHVKPIGIQSSSPNAYVRMIQRVLSVVMAIMSILIWVFSLFSAKRENKSAFTRLVFGYDFLRILTLQNSDR
jgi:hypothetical protein